MKERKECLLRDHHPTLPERRFRSTTHAVRVLVLTVGSPPHIASTQFRFVQFLDSLREKGVDVDLVPATDRGSWPELETYDLVVIQKRLMRVSWVKKVRRRTRRLIFDTDDAIWEPHGRKHSLWARLRTRARIKAVSAAADGCTVPNEYLARYLRQHARRVERVPMALDASHWRPAETRKDGPVRIGWAGAPPNLMYLDRLEGAFREIQNLRPGVEFIIFCGKRPAWKDDLKFTHLPFSPGAEADAVRSFDIGLLPLPDDAFAAGKSPIKALQYAACGVPCVASPVGATNEIVIHGETGISATTEDEWKQAMLALIDDAGERARLGANARAMFLDHHTKEKVEEVMLALWSDLIR